MIAFIAGTVTALAFVTAARCNIAWVSNLASRAYVLGAIATATLTCVGV